MPVYTLIKGTSLSVMRKFFKQVSLYTILIKGISIPFKDQMPTYLVFKKGYSILA
jgi:hypothetical protein